MLGSSAASFLIALVCGLLLTPLVARLARRIGLVDEPSAAKQKLHRRATPLLGGLAVLAAVFLSMWLVSPESPFLVVLMVSASLIALVGLADDIWDLQPRWKLVALLPAPVAAVLLWPEPFPFSFIAIPLFVLGFLFLSNAVNLLDNTDGLTGVMSAITAVSFGIMALHGGVSGAEGPALAMGGACVAFLVFNWRPVRSAGIYLGDMGTLALGAGLFVVFASLVLSAGVSKGSVAALLPIGLVSADVFHTFYARRRIGAGLLSRTREHISQRLHRSGMPAVEITVWLGIVTALSSAAGVVAWVTASSLVAIAAIGIGILVIAYLCYYSLRLRLPEDGAPWHSEKTICHITTQTEDDELTKHLLRVCEGLTRDGWSSHLLYGSSYPTRGKQTGQALGGGATVTHTVPTARGQLRPLSDLRAFLHVYRLMRRLRPQVVHTHDAKAGVLGRIAAALCQVPVILHTYHDLDGREHAVTLRGRITRAIERACAGVSTAMVVTGPDELEALVETGIAPRSKVIVADRDTIDPGFWTRQVRALM